MITRHMWSSEEKGRLALLLQEGQPQPRMFAALLNFSFFTSQCSAHPSLSRAVSFPVWLSSTTPLVMVMTRHCVCPPPFRCQHSLAN